MRTIAVAGVTASGSGCDAGLLRIPQCSPQPAADFTNGNDFPSQHGIEHAAVSTQNGAIPAANNSTAAAKIVLMVFGLIVVIREAT